MRPVIVALSMALLPALIPHGMAQPLQSFEEIGSRVNLGDRVRVRELSGAQFRGSLAGLTLDGISIRSGATFRRLAKAEALEVGLAPQRAAPWRAHRRSGRGRAGGAALL